MRLGLIGKGIMHSSSPDLHVRLGELTGIPVRYDLFDSLETPIDSLETRVHQIMAQGYRGVNVTYPYKEAAIHLATRVGEGARLVGAANTLIFGDAVIQAENTDFTGFISGYRASVGERKPGRVLLIGTGGVGKAVAFGLGKLGAEEIVLLDLVPDKSRQLADELVDAGFPASTTTPDRLEATVGHCDGLVNCTPIGHEKSPGCPLPKQSIQGHQWVFDAVYVPATTEFMAAAKAAGAQVISGVSLFVFQGVDAFKFFCEDADKRVLADAQAETLFNHYKRTLLQETNS